MNSSMCLRCALSRSIGSARPNLKRSIHATRSLRNKADKPRNLSKTPDQAQVSKDVAIKKTDQGFGPQDLKRLTPEEMAELAKQYTPAQISAIEAGEATIDPKDLYEQGAFRQDPYALEYQTDDLSKIMPVIDHRVPAPEENFDPNIRFKNDDEIAADLREYIANAPEDATQLDYKRFIDNMPLRVGKEEAVRNPRTYVRDDIPRGIPALEAAVKKPDPIDDETRQIMNATGMSLEFVRSIKRRVLITHRVVNQTRMGKIQSIYALAIAGNGKGLLGIGEGKSAETMDARLQALRNAVKRLQPIQRYEDRTIFGDVKIKMGAVELELMNRPPGFGVRCQFLIYEMCKYAGIQDLAARVTRSRNKMNTVKAAYQALLGQRIPDEVARGLGKKLVDVRKVYYSGAQTGGARNPV